MMNNELQILERFQCSQWEHTSIREAIAIAKDLTEDINVYVFKKESFTEESEDRTVRTFKDGWRVSEVKPSYYHAIGSSKEPLTKDNLMVTVVSRSGPGWKEPKETFSVTTRFWSLWHTFSIMFGGAVAVSQGAHAHSLPKGSVYIKDKAYLFRLIRQWSDLLSRADGRPMITILGLFTGEQLDGIVRSTKEGFQKEIDALQEYIDGERGKAFEGSELSLLAVGLTGRVRIAITRLEMRKAFWVEWNRTREDVFSLAKTYSLTTTSWDKE